MCCWAQKEASDHLAACTYRVNREGGSRMVQVKQVFAIQSDYAVGRAADAAEAKADECEQGRAFAKVCREMQHSEVCHQDQL